MKVHKRSVRVKDRCDEIEKIWDSVLTVTPVTVGMIRMRRVDHLQRLAPVRRIHGNVMNALVDAISTKIAAYPH